MPSGGMRKGRNCHAERSEASQPMRDETLRCAQSDSLMLPVSE